jgi:hypothetical protein
MIVAARRFPGLHKELIVKTALGLGTNEKAIKVHRTPDIKRVGVPTNLQSLPERAKRVGDVL